MQPEEHQPTQRTTAQRLQDVRAILRLPAWNREFIPRLDFKIKECEELLMTEISEADSVKLRIQRNAYLEIKKMLPEAEVTLTKSTEESE